MTTQAQTANCQDTKAESDAVAGPIFLVGAGRSGTTWLQMLLAQHPQIASAPETQLFSAYLSGAELRWNRELEYQKKNKGRTGLRLLISEDEFYDFIQTFPEKIFDKICKSKPGAKFVLEKTPSHIKHAQFILSLFPEARFIHLIRDPRAVVASLRAAASSWGRHWAPRGVLAGAESWRDAVNEGLAIRELTSQYYELRYEALLADPETEVLELFNWLQLPADKTMCEEIVKNGDISRLRSGKGTALAPSTVPDQFFRKGLAESWRSELKTYQVGLIEHVGGDLMDRLGYQKVNRRPFQRLLLDPPRMLLHTALRRAATGVEWRLQYFLKFL